MMFPLTEPLRRALLLLMCSAPAAQVCTGFLVLNHEHRVLMWSASQL